MAVVIAAAAACSTRDYLIIRILWRTGMRVNELLHIRPADLEHNTKMIRILKAKGNGASAEGDAKDTHKKPADLAADFRLESIKDIKGVLERVVNELLADFDIDLVLRAKVISQLLTTSCKILQVGEYEARLQALEEAAASEHKKSWKDAPL